MTKRDISEDIDIKYNLKFYFQTAKKYRWYFLAIIVLATWISTVDIFGKYLFKALIDRGTDFVQNTITKEEVITNFWQIGILFLVSILLSSCILWLQFRLLNT